MRSFPLDLLGREQIDAAGGNPFARHNLVIGRIDWLKQPDNLERLRQLDEEWDLVVVDEAHKLGATFDRSKNVPKETARYRLGKALGTRTRHFLLLTATPHRGKQADFYLRLALLDPDRFAGSFSDGAGSVDVRDMLRRMMKEDLVGFDGRKLFPERFAWSVSYALSAAEQELYEAVTRYVRKEMGRPDEAARDARADSAQHLRLKCPTDLAANAFYQRVGFRRVGLEHGTTRSLAIWERELVTLPSPTDDAPLTPPCPSPPSTTR